MWNANRRSRRSWSAAPVIVVALASVTAQTPHPPPAAKFDVSSIKRVVTVRDNSRTNIEHGALTATNLTIRTLIRLAFDVGDYQILNAPRWIDEEHYDAAAKSAAARDFTDKQMLPLIQDLLAERFGLPYSRETRTLSGYSLLVANGGPKLKVAGERTGPSTGITTHNSGKVTMNIREMSMPHLAVVLEGLLKQPVTDQTRHSGAYAIQLEYDSGQNPESPLPSLFTALQELGLRLQTSKVPVEMILVEDVRWPSEN